MPPSSAAPTLPRRVLVALALTATLGLGFGGAAAAAQVPTTTAPGLLVPGPSAVTTVPPTTAEPATDAPASDEGGVLDFEFDANEKVWIIVGALVAVALLLLVLTIVYWRHTRPDRSAAVDQGDKASRKEKRRQRKAETKDPFREDDADEAPPRDPAAGPLDLDELLGTPDPARSVFGPSDEPGESPR